MTKRIFTLDTPDFSIAMTEDEGLYEINKINITDPSHPSVTVASTVVRAYAIDLMRNEFNRAVAYWDAGEE